MIFVTVEEATVQHRVRLTDDMVASQVGFKFLAGYGGGPRALFFLAQGSGELRSTCTTCLVSKNGALNHVFSGVTVHEAFTSANSS